MAYLRARRSVKLGGGVKLNLNKRSVGLTVGTRGAHYSVNSRGTRTRTVGLPGTGLSYIDRSRPSASKSGPRKPVAQTSTPAVASAAHSHPGLFARHYERAFFEGVQKLAAKDLDGALAAFRDADESDDKHRAISPALFVGVLMGQSGDYADAVPYLERVATSAQHLPDQLMARYADDQYVSMEIGEGLRFPLRLGSLAASLLLTQAYQHTGRLQEAIGLAQKLYGDGQVPALLALLCSLYRAAEEWDEIVHAMAGVSNEDDTTLLLRIWQAEAMEKQSMPDAALEAYRDALKSKKRAESLLKEARYGRAKLYMSIGKTAMAKRDLGRLYGDDPDYEDVAELLRQLG